ncbi:tail-associated endolysin [Pseudomonas phage Dolphis]|nr:tail-associated endolysin [Pseudomonas phage Dolphis]
MGVVVATHPEDHSVDLVMVDDNSRLTGVQVMTPNGSSRSGSIDLPAVPEKNDKWDISQRTGQDQIAIVGYLGRNPIVTGFLYPQVNQMLSKDPKRMVGRHQSDVQWSIDGDANVQFQHPSGTYIRIGEAPDAEDTAGKNADGNSKADRNTGRKVNVRIGLAGNAVVLTMTPEGAVTFTLEKDFTIEAQGAIAMKAKGDISMETQGEFRVQAAEDAKINGANVRLNEG